MNQQKLDQLLDRVVVDLAAAEASVATYLGDRLGLYESMAETGPVTSAELADRTGFEERYVREWLHCQTAGHYVDYDPTSGRFTLTPEQAAVFADPESTAALVGTIEIVAAMWASADRIANAFKTGEGVAYGEHDPRLASGIGRLFAPLYRASLVDEWIPAVEGLHEALSSGIRVADVGCGTGFSTILMAQAYPNSTFIGYDLHTEALEKARKDAAAAGVADRVTFTRAPADAVIGGEKLGLVCFFDALHDMGDPIGVVAAVASQLDPDGRVLVVEPRAADKLEDNINPVGRWFYAASTFLCTPSALAAGSHALGAQAGPARLTDVISKGGLPNVEVVLETPFNLVIAAHGRIDHSTTQKEN